MSNDGLEPSGQKDLLVWEEEDHSMAGAHAAQNAGSAASGLLSPSWRADRITA